MPACGTPGRKRGHHREPVDPTIALTHTVDAIRILRPAVMAALGHEDQFTPLGLIGRYRSAKATFAGTHGNGRDAPKDPMGVRIATGALPECGC
jgi:hypothetical protein